VQGFLGFLIFADFACAVVLWAMGFRLGFLMMGEIPERPSFLSLRRPLPSELSKEYYAYRRQSLRVVFAFVMVLAVGALLIWIDHLLFRPAD
jgi:uncharacterized membrane protein